MKTTVCLLAAALLLPLPAQAEESTSALAQQLVDLLNPPQQAATGTEALLAQSVDLQVRAKTLGLKLSDTQKAALEPVKRAFVARLRAHADWKDRRDALIHSYSRAFTREQLQRLIAIYTDEVFVMHAQQRELISEALYNEVKLEQAKDQAWFDAQVNRILVGPQ